jgi:chromosome segregation ATPase
VTYFSVRNVLAVCGALFVIALVFLIVAEGSEAGAVLEAFGAQPFAAKLAWAVVVLVPLILVPAAVWLGETLVLQRRAAFALERRLDGVKQSVKALIKPQAEAEASALHLANTDPEDAINAMKQRLTEADRVAQIQQGRNEVGDLNSRVEEIRVQQQGLQKRLAPVLEQRRAIERMFAELDSRQVDMDHALAEIASGDDAVALDNSLKKMMEFVRHSNTRLDDIERASKTVAGLREDYAELQTRMAPYVAADDGVARRLRELDVMRDQLTDEIGSIEQTSQGPLVARVEKFEDDKRLLDGRVSQVSAQYAKLATLRKETDGLFANFDRALDALSETGARQDETDIDVRMEELSTFIEATQVNLTEIERRAGAFVQLRAKLDELQARLNPLQAEDGGVVSIIRELRATRDRLYARIRQIEEEDGGLAERIRKFSETRSELEDRVSNLTDQFTKLATIRKDIAGLFDKLSGAVNTSAT